MDVYIVFLFGSFFTFGHVGQNGIHLWDQVDVAPWHTQSVSPWGYQWPRKWSLPQWSQQYNLWHSQQPPGQWSCITEKLPHMLVSIGVMHGYFMYALAPSVILMVLSFAEWCCWFVSFHSHISWWHSGCFAWCWLLWYPSLSKREALPCALFDGVPVYYVGGCFTGTFKGVICLTNVQLNLFIIGFLTSVLRKFFSQGRWVTLGNAAEE